MPLMLHPGGWWGIRHAKNGKQYVLGRGRLQVPKLWGRLGMWWAGGVQEGPYGWSPALQVQLSSCSRCGYFLDNHPSGVHLTSSTPGEAVLQAKQAPTLILSEWLWLYPTRSSRIHAPLIWGDFVIAAMKTYRVKVMPYDFWGWVRKGDTAGEPLSWGTCRPGAQPPSLRGSNQAREE